MRSAAELLPSMYRKLVRNTVDEESLLLALWPVVVGEKVAARTRAIRLFGASLIVETATQEWRRELVRMTGQIVQRLNAASGREMLKDLEFRVVVKTPPLPPRRAISAAGAARDEATTIADPHLRRLYRLSRQRVQAK